MACQMCQGYPRFYALYVGPWRLHPDNPNNPVDSLREYPRLVAECECVAKKEEELE